MATSPQSDAQSKDNVQSSSPEDDAPTVQGQAERAEWCKLEIMGHNVFYGCVRPHPYLNNSIRVDILPPGDPAAGEECDGVKETYVRDFGEPAIFSITPIGEKQARALSRRDFYNTTALDRSEQKQLVTERMRLEGAKEVVEEEGLVITQEDPIEELGKEIGRCFHLFHELADIIEDPEVSEGLKNAAGDCRRTLNSWTSLRARRLLEEAAPEEGDEDDDEMLF